ncbi:hypothetical protein NDU88_001260 [Pleurodeles waltl]|uniref:Uncharacterized protein n=1 Tax=Pleurodeles waltl TaxID=8319 RepID=A0AAV7TH36_PLEWA|nr:hypothetical protein NDU88_001260 [Pleurodeles waltl]
MPWLLGEPCARCNPSCVSDARVSAGGAAVLPLMAAVLPLMAALLVESLLSPVQGTGRGVPVAPVFTAVSRCLILEAHRKVFAPLHLDL